MRRIYVYQTSGSWQYEVWFDDCLAVIGGCGTYKAAHAAAQLARLPQIEPAP